MNIIGAVKTMWRLLFPIRCHAPHIGFWHWGLMPALGIEKEYNQIEEILSFSTTLMFLIALLSNYTFDPWEIRCQKWFCKSGENISTWRNVHNSLEQRPVEIQPSPSHHSPSLVFTDRRSYKMSYLLSCVTLPGWIEEESLMERARSRSRQLMCCSVKSNPYN